jgi:hypothetical protein
MILQIEIGWKRSYYLIETANWWALTGFGECGGGPAMNQMAIPAQMTVTIVGTAIGFCRRM